MIRVPYYEGPLFQKSTIPINPKPNAKADPNPDHNHNPNLNQILALWHVSAQWTVGIWTFGIVGQYRMDINVAP